MVLSSSSVPIYLDPSNWLQQQSIINSHETLQTPPPLLSLPHGGGDGGRCVGTGSRPSSSMIEQARLAKISPQTETALKCPRCESTNTKFCYFNNYSLTQPRHFCKSCRRYWTIGGALRNVPVGGGCRRNKRSKGRSGRARRSSRSPTKSGILGPSTSASEFASDGFSFDDTIGHQIASQVTLQAPIMPPLRSLGDFHSTNVTTNSMVHGGLGFPIGITSSSSGGGLGSSYLSSGLFDQWKMQQFPNFSTDVEFPTVGLLYQFDDHQREGVVVHPSQSFSGHEPRSRSKPLDSGASIIDAIKLEESQGLNMARNFLGTTHRNINDQQWGANAWRGDPGFASHLAGDLLWS